MSVLVAAHTLGELSAWQLTNLHMQKVLYVGHMLHLGRTGTPLFVERFEAWEYGPVVPQLYRYAKAYKSGPIPPFHGKSFEAGSAQYRAVEDAYALTRLMTPGQLIQCLHKPGGAWEKHYEPGGGGTIQNSDIIEEFGKFVWPSDDAVAWAERMAEQIAAAPSQYLDSSHERAFRERVLAARLH